MAKSVSAYFEQYCHIICTIFTFKKTFKRLNNRFTHANWQWNVLLKDLTECLMAIKTVLLDFFPLIFGKAISRFIILALSLILSSDQYWELSNYFVFVKTFDSKFSEFISDFSSFLLEFFRFAERWLCLFRWKIWWISKSWEAFPKNLCWKWLLI